MVVVGLFEKKELDNSINAWFNLVTERWLARYETLLTLCRITIHLPLIIQSTGRLI
jgi:hypothetical protein